MLILEIDIGKSRYILFTIGVVPVLGYRNTNAFLCNELHQNSVWVVLSAYTVTQSAAWIWTIWYDADISNLAALFLCVKTKMWKEDRLFKIVWIVNLH